VIRFLTLTLFFFCFHNLRAIEIDTSLFSYDKQKVESELLELSNLEKFVNENPEASFDEIKEVYPDYCKMKSLSGNYLNNMADLKAPGNFPSFWFTFIFSTIGTYFIYGIVAGPISVGIVYLSTQKSKIATKKAIWGCVTGTLIGAGIKYVMLNL